MVVRHKGGEGILGHVVATGKSVRMAGGMDMDLSSGFDVKVDSGFKTTSLVCIPVWEQKGRLTSKRNGLLPGKVVGVIMAQNKTGSGEFDEFDESLLRMLGDFVALGISNVALFERSQMLSDELRQEFSGMQHKIEELLAGKETLEAAGEIMRAEEEGGQGRMQGLRKLKALEEEIDRQQEVTDALLR